MRSFRFAMSKTQLFQRENGRGACRHKAGKRNFMPVQSFLVFHTTPIGLHRNRTGADTMASIGACKVL